MAYRLAWTGYAAAGCAILRLPLHLYYGLGGGAGLSVVDRSAPDSPVGADRLAAGSAALRPLIGVLPDWLSPTAATLIWRGTHLAVALLLAAVAVLAVALVRPWGRRLPSPVLIVPAFGIVVAALGYVVGAVVSGLVPRPLRAMVDGYGLDGTGALAGWDRWAEWDVLAELAVTGLGLWALALGLLLALAAAQRLGGPTARRIWLLAVALTVLRLAF